MEYIETTVNQYGLDARMVDGQFVYQKYKPFQGNRWIEVLPPFTEYNPDEVTVPYDGRPSGPEVAYFIRRDEVYGIGKEIFPITFERQLFSAVDAVMRRSYEIRWNNAILDGSGKMRERYVVSGDGELGLFMKGTTGCGKTEAIGKLIKRYPRAIKYTDEEYGEDILLPIAYGSLRNKNSDMSALLRNIAEYIDECVGTPGLYAGKIDKARKLDKRIVIVQNLIREFHVGVLIIDEVQNMDFSSRKSGSIESFLPLLNETNVSLLFCGTNEAYNKVYANPEGYLARRFGEVINASEYCSNTNKKEFRFLVENLFQVQWFPVHVKPTQEMVDALFYLTGGTIGRLKTIYRSMNLKIIEDQERCRLKGTKYEPPIIDAKFIYNIDGKTMPGMAEILNIQRDSDPLNPYNGNSESIGYAQESHLQSFHEIPVPDNLREKYTIVLYLATEKLKEPDGKMKYNPGTIERNVSKALNLPKARTMTIPDLVDKVVMYVTNGKTDVRHRQNVNPLASKATASVEARTI